MKKNSKLTAETLKDILWNTLNGLQDGSVKIRKAEAVASQAREILRTTKLQVEVAKYNEEPISAIVNNFLKDEA